MITQLLLAGLALGAGETDRPLDVVELVDGERVEGIVLFESPGARSFGASPLYVFAALVVAHVLGSTHMAGRVMEKLPSWLFAAIYGALWPVALAFMNGAVQPFIYFQF